MFTKESIKLWAGVVFTGFLLAACSSTQQQGEGEGLDDNGTFEEGEVGALNGNQSAAQGNNYDQGNNYAQDYDNNEAGDGEAGNEYGEEGGNEYGEQGGDDNYAGENGNSYGEEGEGNAEAAGDGGGNYGDGGNGLLGEEASNYGDGSEINSVEDGDNYGNGALETNAEIPTDGQSANEIPVSDETVAVIEAPQPGGIVKYFMSTTSVYDSPGGSAVGSYEQGNHAVVWDEDGWLRMHDGRYVESAGMSDRAVGRARPSGYWQ